MQQSRLQPAPLSCLQQDSFDCLQHCCSDCWWAWLIIWVQTMVGLVMDAVMIGIIFARISHPKYRGRTIAISDSAVISRRDGVLKFMFRIADFRRTQVCYAGILPLNRFLTAAQDAQGCWHAQREVSRLSCASLMSSCKAEPFPAFVAVPSQDASWDAALDSTTHTAVAAAGVECSAAPGSAHLL